MVLPGFSSLPSGGIRERYWALNGLNEHRTQGALGDRKGRRILLLKK
jgi:hypothetical protein